MIDELRAHEFDDIEDAMLLHLLNDQYQDVCSRYLWPFLETKITNASTNANGVLSYTAADLSHIKTLYDNQDSTRYNLLGDVANFYVDGNNQYTFPYYPSISALTLEYYKTPADLTTSTSPVFPAKHHRVVVLGAAARAYYMTDDAELGQLFERQYEDRIVRMAGDLLRRTIGPRKIVDTWPEI